MQQHKTNCFKIKVHMTKTGATHFDDYDFSYNPWKIWENHLKRAIKSDLKKLKVEDYRNELGSFHDERFFNLKIHNPMFGTLIVAIYSEVESCLNKIFGFETYDYKCFNCKLKQYNIDKNKIPYFKEINIIRLKVNSFKHNDMKMSKELAKILGEKEGATIDYTSINIRDLVQQSCKFLWFIEKAVEDFNNATK